ncbi:uncharacterized protein LOC127533348 isoform X4 [Acanthochromis polyacanthus]|uniref:uncharacterized protein LOC127533348 isoform X3 n=1 Tax=Acanthochromis polyacanthus TaxID=80966 RepID=UPI0022345E17|nr:uncharacterized protein LOC127533348 isoform X3 [Acanthochromis polyacanthus]XP_051802084.1 uncharacterized protein LOC127533348 isoform X4 [Acanthochromis polyacanthus]
MDGLYVLLVVFSGIVSCSHHLVSGSVLEVTARPGDNITLYCDCKVLSETSIRWIRNCSHENQPSLILGKKDVSWFYSRHFEFVKNDSSDSYDLLIKNITNADEGLYNCRTTETKVENQDKPEYDYRYSNMKTRIILNSTDPNDCNSTAPRHYEKPELCSVCWTLLFSLSSAFIVLSSLLVCFPCQTTAKDPQDDDRNSHTEGQMQRILDEDVYYAALGIHQATQQPKRKTNFSSELTFCTFSAVRTLRGRRT